MILIADGGSTKIDWLLTDNGLTVTRHRSVGINPTMLAEKEVQDALSAVADECPQLLQADSIEFYGAGCTPVASVKMEKCLREVFSKASSVTVGSDIIGAAKSLFGEAEGIACILGTGACSCQWGRNEDGSIGIVRQTPALGYVLGDEGSGAVLGKLLINALYKGALPVELRHEFEQEYALDMYGVIEKVYRQPQPNRWLASLSPFVLRHIDVPEVEQMVADNLRAFLVRNILPYNRPDLTVSFVGSIAYYYEKQLRREAEALHITVGDIKKSPLAAG